MRRLICLVALSLLLLGAAAARAAAAGGTVEGTVTPVKWAQEVEVCVAEAPPGERCVVPKADGSYSFAGLQGPVRLEFLPPYRSRMLTQFYNHKSTLAEATLVSVAQGEIKKGINADLVEGGAITGTVTAAAGGAPLTEAEVCAVSVGSPTVRICAETGVAGGYELHSLPSGSYEVGFWGEGASAEYEPSSHPIVAITAGQTTAGVDAALAKGAQIKGVVTASAGGMPLAGIAICLFAATDPTAQRCTDSEASGAYSFQGLPGGSYEVGFSLGSAEMAGTGTIAEVDGFAPQYYNGVATREAAQALSLLTGQVLTGVSASLLTPSPPGPAPVIAPAVDPLVAAAPPVAEPKSPAKRCKKGFRKKRVKGKARCVKVRKKAHRKNEKGRKRNRRHYMEGRKKR